MGSFSGALTWVLQYGYPLMLIGMIVEGPVVTAAAAFAAALGNFNIFIVFLLAVLGDFLPDSVYFFIGYHGHSWISQKLMKFLRVSEENQELIRHYVGRHQLKALMLFKYIPFLAGSGLIIMGTTRIPYGKFVRKLSIVSLPNNLFWVLVGYYFGYAFDQIAKEFHDIQLLAMIFIAIGISLFFIFRFTIARVSKRVRDEIQHEK